MTKERSARILLRCKTKPSPPRLKRFCSFCCHFGARKKGKGLKNEKRKTCSNDPKRKSNKGLFFWEVFFFLRKTMFVFHKKDDIVRSVYTQSLTRPKVIIVFIFVMTMGIHTCVVIRYHDAIQNAKDEDDDNIPTNVMVTAHRPVPHYEWEEQPTTTEPTVTSSSSSSSWSSWSALLSKECHSNNNNYQQPASIEDCYIQSIHSLPQLPSMEKQPKPNMSLPIKVFLLMGQSNMVGYGDVVSSGKNKYRGGTLFRAVHVKQKFQHLLEQQPQDRNATTFTTTIPSSSWSTLRNVRYIHMQPDVNDTLFVRVNETLTVKEQRKIGPELQIGHLLAKAYGPMQPILLLKACIGSRSLGWDLLPPHSSRYYSFNGTTTFVHAGYGDPIPKWILNTTTTSMTYGPPNSNLPDPPPDPPPEGVVEEDDLAAATTSSLIDGNQTETEASSSQQPTPTPRPDWYAGKQYNLDVASIKYVLKNLNKFYPSDNNDDASLKYDIQGIFYWQGFNDCVRPIYALRYEYHLYHFIQQLYQDLNLLPQTTKMVIATTSFQQDNELLQNHTLLPYFEHVTRAQLAIGNHILSTTDEGTISRKRSEQVKQQQQRSLSSFSLRHPSANHTTTVMTAATTRSHQVDKSRMTLQYGPPLTSKRTSFKFPYYPEFINNVQTVDTRPHHRPNGPHTTSWRHYYQNAMFVMDVGQLMGMAMINLLEL